MKAAQLDHYAKEGLLTVREIAVPKPAEDEVLVKVCAAAVNPLERLLIGGDVRLIQNYRLPQTLGNECSGVVERVGSRVRKFRPGDAVYTRLPLERIGAFAEYVAVAETAIAKMPAGYAFDVAAALLEKYCDDANCRARGKLLPVPSNTKMNAYLKEIADICQIHKHLTTHLARHTFATLAIEYGMPIDIIAKILGHTNTNMTRRYPKISEANISREMRRIGKVLTA